jgi:hypothetical protein
MLPRYTNSEATSIHGWNDLSDSTPVIVALAALSARAWVEKQPAGEPPLLSREAQVLLAAARERGICRQSLTPAIGSWQSVWNCQVNENWSLSNRATRARRCDSSTHSGSCANRDWHCINCKKNSH